MVPLNVVTSAFCPSRDPYVELFMVVLENSFWTSWFTVLGVTNCSIDVIFSLAGSGSVVMENR